MKVVKAQEHVSDDMLADFHKEVNMMEAIRSPFVSVWFCFQLSSVPGCGVCWCCSCIRLQCTFSSKTLDTGKTFHCNRIS